VELNWEAAGALGEILGAATVVATLFYLARQVRHATSVARSAARQAISQMNVDSWAVSLDPQVLSRAATRATLGDELTPEERGNYTRWILMRMRFVENAHYQYEEGLLDAGEWNGYANLVPFLVAPGSPAHDAWTRASAAYSPRFVQEVERILTGPQPAP
jgi:hypothetical protein